MKAFNVEGGQVHHLDRERLAGRVELVGVTKRGHKGDQVVRGDQLDAPPPVPKAEKRASDATIEIIPSQKTTKKKSAPIELH